MGSRDDYAGSAPGDLKGLSALQVVGGLDETIPSACKHLLDARRDVLGQTY